MTCGTCHRRLPKPKPPKPPKSGLAVFWREVFTAAAFCLPWGPPLKARNGRVITVTMQPGLLTVGATGNLQTQSAWTGAAATEAA